MEIPCVTLFHQFQDGTCRLRNENGRAGEIRTHDLLHPMQAFYQAELRPDLFGTRGCVGRNSGWDRRGMQLRF